jgi:hypothetical protein
VPLLVGVVDSAHCVPELVAGERPRRVFQPRHHSPRVAARGDEASHGENLRGERRGAYGVRAPYRVQAHAVVADGVGQAVDRAGDLGINSLAGSGALVVAVGGDTVVAEAVAAVGDGFAGALGVALHRRAVARAIVLRGVGRKPGLVGGDDSDLAPKSKGLLRVSVFCCCCYMPGFNFVIEAFAFTLFCTSLQQNWRAPFRALAVRMARASTGRGRLFLQYILEF